MKVSTKILNLIAAVSLIFSMDGCNSCKSTLQEKQVKQLIDARQEAEEVTQLILVDDSTDPDQDQDPRKERIVKKWKGTYTDYFEAKQKGVTTTTYSQFLEHSSSVASSTLKIAAEYKPHPLDSRKWYPILEFRSTITNTLDALAQLIPALENEFQTAKQDINKIKGGCSDGTCPFTSIAYVKPEMEKIERLLNGVKNMLDEIKNDNEQISQIGYEAIKVVTQAIDAFKQNTNNFDVSKMEAQRKALFCAFVQSAALFTITLKELFAHVT